MTPGYVAVCAEEPCKCCGRGESWTIRKPNGQLIGRVWEGADSSVDADEFATLLNGAYEEGKESKNVGSGS